MTGKFSIKWRSLRLPALCATLLLAAACSTPRVETVTSTSTLDPAMVSYAVAEAGKLRARGARVWCVPFARNASGVQIRGNAETWWGKAKGLYPRSKSPEVGAVMAFSGTSKLPMGHVAVVSRVISEREVLIDHANWKRNQVSLGMAVRDVSDKNDWSRVRVASNPGSFGSVYALDGFILPQADELARSVAVARAETADIAIPALATR